MITKTLYNLHIYIKEKKLLHVVTFRRKYINNMNSSILFLSELEEMKTCLYGSEDANAGIGL